MMYLIKDLQSQLKYNTVKKEDDEQVKLDKQVKQVESKKVVEKLEQVEPTVYYRQIIADEDDCIYSRPVRRETKYSLNKISRDEHPKIYSQIKVSDEERQSSPSFDSMVRASITRDFCGNY